MVLGLVVEDDARLLDVGVVNRLLVVHCIVLVLVENHFYIGRR